MAAPRGYKQRKARERLAAVRVDSPQSLPGVKAGPRGRYSKSERTAILRAKQALGARSPAPQRSSANTQYNPLAPLTGKRARREANAATSLEFGPQETALRRAVGAQRQTEANTGTYYDDYRQKLREATAHVNETNRVTAEEAQQRSDSTYEQDKAAVAQRDATASETSAKLGRGPVQSDEGARAVEAQRTTGNEQANRARGRSASDIKFMELREANAALGKAQAMGREASKGRTLREDDAKLAKAKGEFKVNYRAKTREQERTYALARKEFGLKEKDLQLTAKQNRRDSKKNRSAQETQKIVARIYAAADKAGARAQVRVAQLQLDKGVLTKDQFKTVRMIYEGLGNDDKGPGKNGKPKLQTWERDKLTNAVRILDKQNALPRDKTKWIKRMQDEGVPLRLARRAWAQYVAQQNAAANTSPGSDRAQG